MSPESRGSPGTLDGTDVSTSIERSACPLGDATGSKVPVAPSDLGSPEVHTPAIAEELAHAFEDATPEVDLSVLIPVRVTGRPVVDSRSGQLGLQDAQASLDEVDVPQDVIDGLLPRVSTYVYLPTFEGLRWTGVQVTQDGVELDFRAEEMTVPTW